MTSKTNTEDGCHAPTEQLQMEKGGHNKIYWFNLIALFTWINESLFSRLRWEDRESIVWLVRCIGWLARSLGGVLGCVNLESAGTLTADAWMECAAMTCPVGLCTCHPRRLKVKQRWWWGGSQLPVFAFQLQHCSILVWLQGKAKVVWVKDIWEYDRSRNPLISLFGLGLYSDASHSDSHFCGGAWMMHALLYHRTLVCGTKRHLWTYQSILVELLRHFKLFVNVSHAVTVNKPLPLVPIRQKKNGELSKGSPERLGTGGHTEEEF